MQSMKFRRSWFRHLLLMVLLYCLLFPSFSPDTPIQAQKLNEPINIDLGILPIPEKLDDRAGAVSGLDLTSGAMQPFLYMPLDVSWFDTMSAMMDHKCPLEGKDGELWTYTDYATAYNVLEERKWCANNDNTPHFSELYCTSLTAPGYEFRTADSQWAWYDGHEGYDWSVTAGTLVYAAADGVVECAGQAGSGNCSAYSRCYGYIVVIAHPNGYKTLYAHLQSNSENPKHILGWPNVTSSDVVAKSGNTSSSGCGSTGNHLHFSVLHNGKYVDPFGWQEWGWGDKPDPLADCSKGETGPRLWVDDFPHRPGQPPIVNVSVPTNLRYVGGGIIPLRPSQYDQATFLSDITLPDHAVVSPGASLVKTWKVRNSGTSPWNGYKLIFVSGDKMGASSPVDIPYTAVGAEREISIPIIAPQTSARGDWQIVNSSGTWVHNGQLWVILDVQGTNPPATSDIDLDCINNSCYATVAPGQTFRPTIRATVNSGQLLESRGDMLRNKEGDLFGAWPHVAVQGTVNAGQSYDFTFYADNPIHAPEQQATYESKWQVWRNGNWAGEEYTIRFTVGQPGDGNRPPNRPDISPGDWGVFDNIPTLHVQHNGDPDGDAITHYYIEIFESHDTPNSGWSTVDSWTPSGLGYYGYQWRAKVRDSRGAESEWSEVHHFSLRDPAPHIYDFHWEWCRDSWGGPEKICFCATTNGGGLELHQNTANDGSENGEWKIIGHGDTNLNCNTDDDRPPNWGQLEHESGTYRIRLYARPKGPGGWEAAYTADITVPVAADQRPGPPFGKEPGYNAYLGTQAIHFDWIDTWRTTNYRLEVATDSNYTTHLVDVQLPVSVSEYDYLFDTDYETVYWRVTATGPYGAYENGQYFHIDITPPTTAMTALPSITFDTKFTVNWAGSDARSGLRWYHVQMRDVSRPGSVWEDWLVNTTKTAEMFQGQPGHTYAFRVRAMDAIGNWEDWPTDDTGDTYTQVDPSAAPTTAWWDAGYAQKRNLVILNNDSDTLPTDFPVQIHFDASTMPTAAEIYNASLAATKGDDVRVVYHNQTEVYRFVQRFTADQIDLWFPLQADLGGGQTDSGSYQIYYGNAGASNPPADVNNVFLPKTDSNTIGLWHFQDGAGTMVADSSGNSNNGVFNSGTWADGFMGWAGNFNGVDSSVIIPHSDVFNATAMTIEAWVYITANDGKWSPIVMKIQRLPDGPGGFEFRLTDSRQIRWLIKDYWLHSNAVLNTHQWYHIAAITNGTNEICIYINGNQNKCQQGGPLDFNTAPITIGFVHESGGDLSFPGYIQHVKISNIARYDFPYARVDVSPSIEAGVSIAPPTPGSPDLAILNLATYPNIGGGLLVLAQVQNQGDASTQNNFYTDLYVDHLPTGTGDYTGSLQFWVNSPIAAGAQVTLTTVITDLAGLGKRMARTLATPGSEVTATLYTQVDSVGVISETDNTNNISAGVEICLASADAYEGDDDTTGASVMALGQTQSHNFDSLADRDWVQFEAQGGVTYTLRTFDLSSGADTYLYLYASDGVSLTLLAANDDYGGSLASRIDWLSPVTGTYYLLAQHWNPNVGGCGTGYKLAFKEYQAGRALYLPLIMKSGN